ncbi:MAG TPA: hypothetical protein EYH16_00615 [Leucothrix mucor]|nr:hypothetical protein [Leucothrix mucor]
MNNPYKPPDSMVISKEESSRYRPSFGWKFYFWFSVVMFTLNILLFVVGSIFSIDLISYNLMDVVDFIVWSIATIAIFGLAWSRKLFSLKFWRVYFHIFILWFVIYSLVAPFGFNMPKYGTLPTFTDLLYETPFFFLTLLGLFSYTNRMNELWRN